MLLYLRAETITLVSVRASKVLSTSDDSLFVNYSEVVSIQMMLVVSMVKIEMVHGEK